jgi:uncharacterized protein (DUF1697 family)
MELGLLDCGDASSSATCCGLPVAQQVARLESTLQTRFGEDVSVVVCDLTDLPDLERHVALDAMVADEPSPYVLVGGRVVCTGSVDAAAVLAALS